MERNYPCTEEEKNVVKTMRNRCKSLREIAETLEGLYTKRQNLVADQKKQSGNIWTDNHIGKRREFQISKGYFRWNW